MNTVIGRKVSQTQVFLTDGTRLPVTKVEVSDNAVVGVKTDEKHGYSAVQLGYGTRKKTSKTVAKLANGKNPLVVREVRLASDEAVPTVGDMVSVDTVLKPGDIVKVVGTSKGKGFAGVVKRHNFRGGPRTHGQSDRERAPGSIGQTTTPGRVYRGKRMAGRMGHEITSVTNLNIVDVIIQGEVKTLLVKGLVPGPVNSIVQIVKTGELPEKKIIPVLKSEEGKAAEEVKEVATIEVAETDIAESEPKPAVQAEVAPEIKEVKVEEETIKEAK